MDPKKGPELSVFQVLKPAFKEYKEPAPLCGMRKEHGLKLWIRPQLAPSEIFLRNVDPKPEPRVLNPDPSKVQTSNANPGDGFATFFWPLLVQTVLTGSRQPQPGSKLFMLYNSNLANMPIK